MELFYTDSDDVINDLELQAWIHDLNENGFPSDLLTTSGNTESSHTDLPTSSKCLNQYQTHTKYGLPKQITCIEQLTDLVSKIIFTSTCAHTASHSEAMDMYGFEPSVPARMCACVPEVKGRVKKADLVSSLPEQNPELYSCGMAYVMSLKKADEVSKPLI